MWFSISLPFPGSPKALPAHPWCPDIFPEGLLILSRFVFQKKLNGKFPAKTSHPKFSLKKLTAQKFLPNSSHPGYFGQPSHSDHPGLVHESPVISDQFQSTVCDGMCCGFWSPTPTLVFVHPLFLTFLYQRLHSAYIQRNRCVCVYFCSLKTKLSSPIWCWSPQDQGDHVLDPEHQ